MFQYNSDKNISENMGYLFLMKGGADGGTRGSLYVLGRLFLRKKILGMVMWYHYQAPEASGGTVTFRSILLPMIIIPTNPLQYELIYSYNKYIESLIHNITSSVLVIILGQKHNFVSISSLYHSFWFYRILSILVLFDRM